MRKLKFTVAVEVDVVEGFGPEDVSALRSLMEDGVIEAISSFEEDIDQDTGFVRAEEVL